MGKGGREGSTLVTLILIGLLAWTSPWLHGCFEEDITNRNGSRSRDFTNILSICFFFLPGHNSSDACGFPTQIVYRRTHTPSMYTQKVGTNASAKLAFKGRICSSGFFFRLHQRQCQSSSSLRSKSSNLPVPH